MRSRSHRLPGRADQTDTPQVTNSIDQTARVEQCGGSLATLDIAPVIAEAIRRTHNGQVPSPAFGGTALTRAENRSRRCSGLQITSSHNQTRCEEEERKTVGLGAGPDPVCTYLEAKRRPVLVISDVDSML